MPTPARLAMSSSGASAPRSANAAVAALISRAWFCRASARNCSAGRGGSWSDVLVIASRLTGSGPARRQRGQQGQIEQEQIEQEQIEQEQIRLRNGGCLRIVNRSRPPLH